MRTLSVKSFLLCVMVALTGDYVFACSCIGTPLPCQAFGDATAVFTGTVIGESKTTIKLEGEQDYAQRLFEFRLDESFSGVQGGSVQVVTGQGGGDCGYDFKQGERYLVYAYRNLQTNRLHTGICGRTRPVAQAEEDFAYLRNLSKLASGATLSGQVQHFKRESGSTRSVGSPMSNAKIVITTSEGNRMELRTDKEGSYRLAELKPGKYKVKIELPDDLATYEKEQEQEITLADKGCGQISFSVLDNGRVSGIVTDATGQPVPKILLQLVPVDQKDNRERSLMSQSADDNGRYEFEMIPAGTYLLGVRLDGLSFPDAQSNAYPKTYYPGVANLTEAVPITVAEGQNVQGKDLRLLPGLVERVITGNVLLSNESPARNARIGYQEISEKENASSYGSEADAQGQFSIKAYQGFSYLISAHINTENGQMHAEPVEVTVDGEVKSIKLVITEPNGTCERCRAIMRRKAKARKQ